MSPKMFARSPMVVGAVLLTMTTAPGHAEWNRLLPFWAQPYPTGFVRVEPGPDRLARRCVVRRAVRTPQGLRTVVEDRCRAVLHARD